MRSRSDSSLTGYAGRLGVAGDEAFGQLISEVVSGPAGVLGDDQVQLGEEPAEVHGLLTPADSVEIDDSADGIAGEEYLGRGEVSVTQHGSGPVAVGADAIGDLEVIQPGANVVRDLGPHLLHHVELEVELAR